MIPKWLGPTILSVGIVFSGLAVSHDMPYLQAQPGKPNPSTGIAVSMSDCGTGNNFFLNLSFGVVCFGSRPEHGWGDGNWACIPEDPPCEAPPQHLTDEPIAWLDITDTSGLDVPATYCQDLNLDRMCGGNRTGAPEPANPDSDPLCQMTHQEGVGNCTLRSEPYVEFCDSIAIGRGLTGPTTPENRRPGGVFPGTAGSGDWADPLLANWAIDDDVYVYLSTPSSGNVVLGNACSANAWATQGWVSHT